MPDDRLGQVLPLLMVFVDFLVLANHRPPAFEDTALQFHFITMMHFMLITIFSTVPPFPGTSLPLHERLLPEYVDTDADWTGYDLFGTLSVHRRMFWYATANTPETFQSLFNIIRADLFAVNRKRNFKLSPRNRVLMTLIGLRHYPTYAMMSVTLTSASQLQLRLLSPPGWSCGSIFRRECSGILLENGVVSLESGLKCPMWLGLLTQLLMKYKYQQITSICSTPTTENFTVFTRRSSWITINELYSGFDGHENDAVTSRQLPSIGPGLDLDFPQELRLLGDSIYPYEYPLITQGICY